MKYLRTFNESLFNDDVIDLMLDISDMGYKCSVNTKWTGGGEATPPGQDSYTPHQNYIMVEIIGRDIEDDEFSSDNRIKYKEIMPTINRITEYLKTKDYHIEEITISRRGGPGWEDVSLEELNSLVEDGTLDLCFGPRRFKFQKR